VNHYSIAPALDRLADQLVVVPFAVAVGGVEDVDAAIDRALDRRNAFVVVLPAVDARHAHAAEAELRDLEVGDSEFSVPHNNLLPIPSPSRIPSPPFRGGEG
jgi:hypothetical protein